MKPNLDVFQYIANTVKFEITNKYFFIQYEMIREKGNDLESNTA